jgi:hypothetical protein
MSLVPETSADLHGVARTRTIRQLQKPKTPAASNPDWRFSFTLVHFTLVHRGFDEATMPVISGVAAANQTLEPHSQAARPVPP